MGFAVSPQSDVLTPSSLERDTESHKERVIGARVGPNPWVMGVPVREDTCMCPWGQRWE